MSPPFDVALELNRHGAALRRLAGELVADRHAADDAVQQVWLDALQRPPRHGGAITGWLATALRNVVVGWRRGDRRRERRESVVIAARGDVVEDHAVMLEREELAERLFAAVRSLEPAHRDAIWQRFFEGKAPRDIAAAACVPVETVKSRLKRALGTLRERLGEREGSDWRAGFVAAFGLGREGTTTATAAIAGGVMMATWTKMTAAIVAAAAAVLAFVWWPDAAAATPATATGGKPPNVASAPEDTKHRGELSGGADRTAASPAAIDPKLAIVRGRCVDANGAPISGCAVELFGWPGKPGRDEEWMLEHGSDHVEHHAATSADGRFEFAIEPPPFVFKLRVQGDSLARAGIHWDSIEPGATIDVGDLTMQPGITLRGRIVDPAGLPVGDVRLDANNQSGARMGAFAPESFASGRSLADGSFVFDAPLAYGSYSLRMTDGYEVKSPVPLVLPGNTPVGETRIIVERPVVPTITGAVVGDAGQPVRYPRLEWTTGAGEPESTYGKQDGSFELRCTAGDATRSIRLAVRAEGYCRAELGDEVPWGASAVRVQLQRGAPDLTMFVRDRAGRALEGCTLRLLPTSTSQAGRFVARARSDANGAAMIASLARGEYVIAAQFAASRGLPATIEHVVLDGSPANVEIRIGGQPSRRLRVQRRDGTPVAGTRVQLCEMLGNSFASIHQVLAPRIWFLTNWSAPPILALADGATDADGTLLLTGPAGCDLGLRVLGPGHVAIERTDVRADDPGDLVVTVATGARVRGRIEPAAAVDALRRLAGVGVGETFPPEVRPLILLRGDKVCVPRTGDPEAERHAFSIADDGSFDVAGVPEGQWQIDLRYFEKTASMTSSRDAVLATHLLRDGESIEIATDLGALVPGTIRGLVLRNGEPWPKQLLSVVASRGAGPDGKEQQEWMMAETDADGRFELINRPGRYELRGPDGAVAKPAVDVVRAEVVPATFEFTLGDLVVRVLRPDGGPASGVDLLGGMTDADGKVCVTLQPRTVPVRVLPRGMATREARAQARAQRAGGSDPFAAHWIELGQATVVAGRTTSLELRLPPEWEK